MADLKAAARKRSATVKVGGKAKFPIPDKKHAALAIGYEDKAKPPLTPAQRSAVESKEAKFGVGPKAKKAKKSS
jgi:hypothetical protein